MKDWQLVLLVLVLYTVALLVWRHVRRTRGAPRAQQPPTPQPPHPQAAVMPRSYNPSKVGNDSAARPWESVPAGFVAQASAPSRDEENAFISQARDCFVEMQRAWDRADVAGLRAMMTEEMVDLLGERLHEREQQGASPQAADIVILQARFLGQEQTEAQWIASVEFSGMVREAHAQTATPFREIWDLTKVRDVPDARWRVAGVQSLQ